jgi:heme exporter protein C
MMTSGVNRIGWLWGLGWALAGLSVCMAAWYAPTDPSTGLIQKISYLHLGTAIGTLLSCVLVFIASVAYLWQHDPRWDALGAAAARTTVLMLTIVLLTGMLWARKAWGHWWEWSPPLTFSLVLWLLFMGHLVLRGLMRPGARRAAVCAAFGVVAFLDVPLVYLSVQFLPDSHISPGVRTASMHHTLLVSTLAATVLTMCLVLSWYRGLRAEGGARAGRVVPVRGGVGTMA